MNEIEEGFELKIDFTKLKKVAEIKEDIIPVVTQNVDTKEVLVISYINEKALKRSLETKRAVYWSTSRNELWEKGKSSGDVLDLVEVRVNCEQNSLLLLVRPRKGGVCHTKDKSGKTRRTCYYRKINPDGTGLEFIEHLE